MFRLRPSKLVLALFGLACLMLNSALRAAEPADWARENLDALVKFYRHLHQTPELSLHEKETATRIAQELRDVGADVTTNFGGYGVVGVLANGPGPRVMVRTDLDALPVTEMTQLAYASKVKVKNDSGQDIGVMHACGHDIHMTCLIGTARYLAANKDRWSGTVIFIGQPAEERVSGARAMLDAGLFEKFPKPDYALALHCDSSLAAGKVGVRAGYTLANTDSVDIIVRGRGGHGAFPHTTVDPIVEAAHLILDLQTIVSREVKPTDPAVITVGSIQGGTKHNIIPDSCHLQLTIRSYTSEVRDQLLTAIKRKAMAAAASAGAPEPTITVTDGTTSTFHNEKLTERVAGVFRKVLGSDKVVASEPTMGGEDFGRYGMAGVPIFMFWLGAVDSDRLAGYTRVGQKPPSLHSALFYPDAEPTLQTGITAMSSAVLDLLKK